MDQGGGSDEFVNKSTVIRDVQKGSYYDFSERKFKFLSGAATHFTFLVFATPWSDSTSEEVNVILFDVIGTTSKAVGREQTLHNANNGLNMNCIVQTYGGGQWFLRVYNHNTSKVFTTWAMSVCPAFNAYQAAWV